MIAFRAEKISKAILRKNLFVDDMTTAADGAELGSMSSVMGDLAVRVAEVARRYEGTDREDVAFELYEVERGLRGATRRLDRLTRSL